jgi:hypothetical protein
MDVRAADADDLRTERDLPGPRRARGRDLEQLHRALAARDRRQHGRDPIG